MSLRDPAYAGSWQSSWDRHSLPDLVGSLTLVVAHPDLSGR